jgi:hypothetical protein
LTGSVTLYAQWKPVPTVSKVSPNSGPAGGGTLITITGTGFVTGATVQIGQGHGTIGAIRATVRSITSTTITAVTGGGAKTGTFSVYVHTPGGTSAGSAGANFTYNTRPTVTAISPRSGPAAGGTAITITGTGFVTGATVEIAQGSGVGPSAIVATSVNVVSSTEITAVTGGGAKTGTFGVFVITPAGTSAGTVFNVLFTYT